MTKSIIKAIYSTLNIVKKYVNIENVQKHTKHSHVSAETMIMLYNYDCVEFGEPGNFEFSVGFLSTFFQFSRHLPCLSMNYSLKEIFLWFIMRIW